MNTCITCSNTTKNLICDECWKNPYRIEDIRKYFAVKGEIAKLKKLYSNSCPEIKNVNTSKFWDKIFIDKLLNFKEEKLTEKRNKEIIKMIKKNGGSMLDIGIGSGSLEKKILKKRIKNLSFYGIDISRVSINEVKKNIPGIFINGSIYKIPFQSNFFDIVVCLEVLEHIPPSRVFGALDEVWRTCREGGLLIVSVPLNEGLEELTKIGQNPSGHVRVYTPDLIKSELEISGFKVFNVKFFYAFDDLFFLKNLFAKTLLNRKWKFNSELIFARKSQ